VAVSREPIATPLPQPEAGSCFSARLRPPFNGNASSEPRACTWRMQAPSRGRSVALSIRRRRASESGPSRASRRSY